MEIKVNGKLLKNYAKYKREIEILREEIYELEYSDAGLGNDVIFDYKSGFPKPQAIVGRDSDRIQRRREKLEKRQEQVDAVEQWIEDIEDAETRAVFRMRYIDQLNWIIIARRMKYNSVDYARIRIRDKYLEDLKIK